MLENWHKVKEKKIKNTVLRVQTSLKKIWILGRMPLHYWEGHCFSQRDVRAGLQRKKKAGKGERSGKYEQTEEIK